VPQGLGLGSSGATAAASAKALDHLFALNLSNDELVQTASLGEKAVTGTAHADNVAASLLGGFVVVYDDPVKTISIKHPPNLRVVVASPELSFQRNKTRKARALVPNKIATRRAVLNIGRASAIATGFAVGNVPMIGGGMQDEIAEPYRRVLIPGYDDVRKMALEAGATGVSISGAGPSMIALVDGSRCEPKMIARAMIRGFIQANVRSTCFVARPASGAKIIQAN
jgi:homoserine kinase